MPNDNTQDPSVVIENSASEQAAPPEPRKISKVELDNIGKLRANISLAQAELTAAQKSAELAEMAFKYNVLELYRKYNMQDQDKITDDGTIISFKK